MFLKVLKERRQTWQTQDLYCILLKLSPAIYTSSHWDLNKPAAELFEFPAPSRREQCDWTPDSLFTQIFSPRCVIRKQSKGKKNYKHQFRGAIRRVLEITQFETMKNEITSCSRFFFLKLLGSCREKWKRNGTRNWDIFLALLNLAPSLSFPLCCEA